MTRKPAHRLTAAGLLIVGIVVSRMTVDGELATDNVLTPIPLTQPEFVIRWHDDRLELSGHTLSSQHEQELLQLAAASYPGASIEAGFEPLGIVPEYWDRMTVQILYLLSETISATARLGAHTIEIRGVSPKSPGWQSRLAAVQDNLPDEVLLEADALVVNTAVDIGKLCQRVFEQFDAGPINFEESGTTFRSSAFPRLQRVVSLAKACPAASVAITGHTDATGPEAWNRQLSLQRAQAVGAYLARGGIASERLTMSGKGSAEPVADNATRYGRSKNRRIQIEFQP